MEAVSIEKCLDVIPNKFRLAVLAMNRARDILMGAKTNVETSKYTQRAVNKALREIEIGLFDKVAIAELEKNIGKNLISNNLFPKKFANSTGDATGSVNSETTKDINMDDEDVSAFQESADEDSLQNDENIPVDMLSSDAVDDMGDSDMLDLDDEVEE